MSTNLPRSKRVRAGHRASTTKIIRRLEEVLAADPLDKDKLSQLKLTLGEKLEVLKRLDAEILTMVEEGVVADEIEQSDAFKEDIYTAIVRIERTLTLPTVPVVSMDPAPRASVAGSTSQTASYVKLPKLTIPPQW